MGSWIPGLDMSFDDSARSMRRLIPARLGAIAGAGWLIAMNLGERTAIMLAVAGVVGEAWVWIATRPHLSATPTHGSTSQLPGF
jgi:hypothetical protein